MKSQILPFMKYSLLCTVLISTAAMAMDPPEPLRKIVRPLPRAPQTPPAMVMDLPMEPNQPTIKRLPPIHQLKAPTPMELPLIEEDISSIQVDSPRTVENPQSQAKHDELFLEMGIPKPPKLTYNDYTCTLLLATTLRVGQ